MPPGESFQKLLVDRFALQGPPVVPIAVDIWGVDGGFAMDLNFLTMDLRWICLFDTFFACCEACCCCCEAQNFLHTVGNLQFPLHHAKETLGVK